MTKIFPKSRICVIDALPSVEAGVRIAIEFAQKHNISLQTNDGRKIILTYCLKEIESLYKDVKSLYPKVICISSNTKSKKILNFITNHLDKLMNNLYFPYCGKYDLNSPELEIAAEASLSHPKTNRRFLKLKSKLKAK